MKKAIILLASMVITGLANENPALASCTSTPPGIVAWWQAESNTLDSVDGNSGTLENSAGYESGKVGTAFSLDGVDDFVLIQTTNDYLDVGVDCGFTIEGWINPSSLSSSMLICEYERALATSSGSDVGAQFLINAVPNSGLIPGALAANIVDTTGTSHIFGSASYALTNGVWQHVALRYDVASGVAALYVNGVTVAQTNFGSFTPQTSFTNLLLGARTTFNSLTHPSDDFSGGMDEISFYERALSTNEIATIFNAGTAGKCNFPCDPVPSGIVGWWPAECNALDLVSENDGILENSAGFMPGAVGEAFDLDGTDDFVLVQTVNSNLDIGASGGFTMEGWIAPTNLNSSMLIVEYERALATFSGSDVGAQFLINAVPNSGLIPGALAANIVDTTDTSHIFGSSAYAVTNGMWQHVALTYDKSSGLADLYVNGTIVAQTNFGSFTAQTSFTNVLFGARTTFNSVAHPSDRFSGGLDEISFYNRALSTNEIRAIYNASSDGKCR